MNAKQLVAHFERMSDAPDAVPRLRRFVFDLAVRGRLLPQIATDAPVSALLSDIRGDKTRATNSATRPAKGHANNGDVEGPFSIPSSWVWTTVDAITSYIQRGKSPEYSDKDGALVVSQKCVQWTGLDLAPARRITFSSLEGYEPVRFLREGDLLWNSTGTGTIGRLVRVVAPPAKLVCDSHVTVVRCARVDPEYVRTWLRSDDVFGSIEERAAGSTNQVELTSEMVRRQVVPLPPLEEQHRIVAKVAELMKLCDELEAAQKEREARHNRLTVASLARLNQPAHDASEFRDNARFHLRNLPRLVTKPEHVKQLRPTILNLAVRGKLVPPQSSDEQASALIRRCQLDVESYAEKHRVPRAKLDSVAPEQTPFNVPSTWSWARLAALCRVITDGDHLPPPKTDQGVAFLTIGNVSSGQLDFDGCRKVPQAYFDDISMYRRPERGCLLYTVVGATYGRPVIVNTDRPFCVQRHIAIVKPAAEMPVRYLHLLLSSPFVYEQATQCLTGTAQPTIPLRPLRNFLVPVPPLSEQRRIVAKADELMAICDQLDAQLAAKEAGTQRLLEAILHEALAEAA